MSSRQRDGMAPEKFGAFNRDRIVDFVRDYGERYHTSPPVPQIAEAIGVSERQTRKHVQRLVAEGRLESDGYRSLRVPGSSGPGHEESDQDTPWVVTDGKVAPGERCPVLGRFATHDLAARFTELLPEHETGRYGLDGPSVD